MPESRGRRLRANPKPADKNLQRVLVGRNAQIGKPNTAGHKTALNLWKDVWAILGPVVALTGLVFLLLPQIKIEAFVNPNPSDPIGTQFLISNPGNVPIHKVRFGCAFGVGGGSTYIGKASINMPATLSPLGILPPGESATRSCVVSSDRSEISNMRFTVAYEWPLIGIERTKQAFYRVLRARDGIAYLLPDIPPARGS